MDGADRPAPDRVAARAEERAADAALRARLVPAARRGFFALLALIERLSPAATRIGGGGPPGREAIRLRHDPALTFHPGDVARIEVVRPPPAGPFDAEPPHAVVEVTTTFLGLSGTVSPMPTHLAEEVAREDPERPVQRAFLDLFHHRLLSLLYRLVARHDVPGELAAGAVDEWSTRVLALAGVDLATADPGLPRWQLLRLAPLLASRARGGDTLERALTLVLGEELGGARVVVEELVGRWVEIEDDQRCRLGRVGSTLGRDLVVGRRVFDRAGTFRVRLGPLGRTAFERLRPGGQLHALVRATIAQVVPDPLDAELELALAIEDTPPLTLSARGEARLGRSAWLGRRRPDGARLAFALDP